MLCALWEISPFINVFMCHIEALWLNLRTRYASTFEFPFEMKWLKIQFWIFDGPIQQIKRLLHFMNENKCMYVYKQGLKVHDFEMTKHLVGNLEHYYLLSSSNLHSFPGPKKSCHRNEPLRSFYNVRWTPLLGLLVKSAHYLFHN